MQHVVCEPGSTLLRTLERDSNGRRWQAYPEHRAELGRATGIQARQWQGGHESCSEACVCFLRFLVLLAISRDENASLVDGLRMERGLWMKTECERVLCLGGGAEVSPLLTTTPWSTTFR